MENVRQIGRPMTSLIEQIIGIVTAFTSRYEVPIQNASVVVPPISFTIVLIRYQRGTLNQASGKYIITVKDVTIIVASRDTSRLRKARV